MNGSGRRIWQRRSPSGHTRVASVRSRQLRPSRVPTATSIVSPSAVPAGASSARTRTPQCAATRVGSARTSSALSTSPVGSSAGEPVRAAAACVSRVTARGPWVADRRSCGPATRSRNWGHPASRSAWRPRSPPARPGAASATACQPARTDGRLEGTAGTGNNEIRSHEQKGTDRRDSRGCGAADRMGNQREGRDGAR